MLSQKVKVIYITGEERSGSTLLERILGQHDKIFAAGELIHIWERSFIDNQLCSCRKSFNECRIWNRIVNIFLQKLGEEIKLNFIIEALLKTSRIRQYLIGKDFDNKYAEFINKVYTNLYETIIESTGKEFLIDASKHPVFAHILANNKNINLYVIHLVRDSRGVAYSWTKKKIRPEIINRKEYMPRYSVVRSAISWNVINKIALDLQKINGIKYIMIKYENFILKPRDTLNELYKFLELEPYFEMFKDNKSVYLSQNHTVVGNPIRFKVGNVTLELDEEWKRKFRKDLKLLVTLLTYPCLRRFGYV